MRFEEREFKVQYDADRVEPKRMLAAISGLGFTPSLLAKALTATEEAFPDTAELSTLLSHIVEDGRIDHARLAKERAVLDRYLAEVAGLVLPKTDERTLLAFYINAYNAGTLALVLKHVRGKGPDGTDLGSVLDVPDFFKKAEIEVGKKMLSLDELEGLGRKLGDPRIHFAVNCASISCPVLRDHAWTAETLDRDLEAATKSYFASEQGFQIRNGQVYVSSILDWYKDDFGGKAGVRAFLLRYLPAAARGLLAEGISFLPYDWQLNRKR